MTLEEALYKQLTTATLTTKLGSTAIYPMVAPQSRGLPYVTYQQISDNPIHAMTADPSLRWTRYQVSYWSSSIKQGRTLANAGRNVLRDFSGSLGNSVAVQRIFYDNEVMLPEIDPETKKPTFQIAQDYLIWHTT